MDRSHLLAFCLACSAYAYGMDRVGSTPTVVTTVQAPATSSLTATEQSISNKAPMFRLPQALAVLSKFTNRQVALARESMTRARNGISRLVAATKEKGEAIINNARVKAVESYVRTQADAAQAYVKENPVKASLIVIGGCVVTAVAVAIIKEIRRSIRYYHAQNDNFCCCCGKKIEHREPKYLKQMSGFESGSEWMCRNCFAHLSYGQNNARLARCNLRYQ